MSRRGPVGGRSHESPQAESAGSPKGAKAHGRARDTRDTRDTNDRRTLATDTVRTGSYGLAWRELTPHAEALFETFPQEVSEWWATTDGLVVFSAAMVLRDQARREFARTSTDSALWRWREREVSRLEARFYDVSGNVLAALRSGIRQVWPQARPEQVLLLIQRRLGELTVRMVTEVEDGVFAPNLTPGDAVQGVGGGGR